jgi:long-chain acyl-CoA synthetase
MSGPTKESPRIESATTERHSLIDLWQEAVKRHGDRPALIADGGLGRSYTYADVDRIIREGAGRLRATGENLFALAADNCPEWAIAYLTIVAANRTVVPLDPNLKPTELAALIRLSGARIILTTDKLGCLFIGLSPDLRVISLERNSDRYWLKVLPDGDSTKAGPVSDEAALIYTSGTTGDPKAVVLTHRNFIANLEGIRKALRFSENDVFLSVLPLHHTFEATCGFLTPLLIGCCVVYARSFKSKEILEDIGRNQATVMCGVPLLFEKMHHSVRRGIQGVSLMRRVLFWILFGLSRCGWWLGVKAGRPLFASFRRQSGLGSIRMFVCGGAAVPTSIARYFNLTGFDFLQGYGMTECSPVISVNRPDDNRFGSVGPPLCNVQVRIDNRDSEGVGEICVKADSVTPGYKGNPARTAELVRDGWLYTGDLGQFRKGHLWITGRAKNVIVSAAGKNIYPEELEERLLESPYVLEAIVVGKPKAGGKQGEDVFAIIVPDVEQIQADDKTSIATVNDALVRSRLNDVIAEVNGRIAEYKRIVGFDISAAELEKTAAKKVKRHVYRQPPQIPPAG